MPLTQKSFSILTGLRRKGINELITDLYFTYLKAMPDIRIWLSVWSEKIVYCEPTKALTCRMELAIAPATTDCP